MADTTDAEIRNAIAYMFNPSGAVASAATKAAAAPPKPAGKRVTVGGMEVYLGLTPAEALRAYPKEPRKEPCMEEFREAPTSTT